VSGLRFAYADPPYVGMAARYDHPDTMRWNEPDAHIALMAQMDATNDGWALSLHVPSLPALSSGMPDGARISAWVKPFASYKKGVRVAYTWEPVIWRRTAEKREGDPFGRDHLSCNIAMQKGFFGAKPEAFCRWVLMLLGWQPGDTVDDLFPGTGVMGRIATELRLAL
jgi:hypothetical protein